MTFPKGHGKIADHEYVVSVWFERDRASISLSTPKGREIFCLWDDDVHQAIEDGFLPTPLRVNEATGCIDTSHSAHIPTSDARRLWPVILEVKAGGIDMPFERPLGLYELRLIRADGSIVVGCHDIPWSELEGIAKQLGLLNVEEVL